MAHSWQRRGGVVSLPQREPERCWLPRLACGDSAPAPPPPSPPPAQSWLNGDVRPFGRTEHCDNILAVSGGARPGLGGQQAAAWDAGQPLRCSRRELCGAGSRRGAAGLPAPSLLVPPRAHTHHPPATAHIHPARTPAAPHRCACPLAPLPLAPQVRLPDGAPYETTRDHSKWGVHAEQPLVVVRDLNRTQTWVGQGRAAGQGRAGQGRAGQGRAGQRRAGQGRAAQGRAGQGRAGQGGEGGREGGEGGEGGGGRRAGRGGQNRWDCGWPSVAAVGQSPRQPTTSHHHLTCPRPLPPLNLIDCCGAPARPVPCRRAACVPRAGRPSAAAAAWSCGMSGCGGRWPHSSCSWVESTRRPRCPCAAWTSSTRRKTARRQRRRRRPRRRWRGWRGAQRQRRQGLQLPGDGVQPRPVRLPQRGAAVLAAVQLQGPVLQRRRTGRCRCGTRRRRRGGSRGGPRRSSSSSSSISRKRRASRLARGRRGAGALPCGSAASGARGCPVHPGSGGRQCAALHAPTRRPDARGGRSRGGPDRAHLCRGACGSQRRRAGALHSWAGGWCSGWCSICPG